MDHSRETLFAFLADMTNHPLMTDRYLSLECVSNDPAEGRVTVSGPLGIRRTAKTEVTGARAPECIAGTATAGPSTCARVAWRLAPDGEGSRVIVRVDLVRAGALDRLLLAAGGRWWLRRRLRGSLRRLEWAVNQAENGARPAAG